jgi:chloride channel 3/4/5
VLTTTLGFLNPYTRMGGTELVYNLFAECQPGGGSHEGLCVEKFAPIFPVITAIAAAMFIKGALTVITFGTKVPAGIFIPSLGAFILGSRLLFPLNYLTPILGVGACFGRIVGLLVQCVPWTSCVHSVA